MARLQNLFASFVGGTLVFSVVAPSVGLAESVGDAARSFASELKKTIELVGTVIAAAPEYAKKRSELRAARSRACPISTGYDEAAATSAAGRADLARKAAVYEQTTDKHVAALVLMKEADIDPTTKAVLRFPSEVGDCSYHSGQLLAARAYKYGVTRAARDLTALKTAVDGAYNLLTIAGAPAGRVLDPRTGKTVAPRKGLPVRGYVTEGDQLFRGNSDIDLAHTNTYIYEGTLRGLSARRFIFVADVSGDQTDGLLFGMTAAYEVLAKAGVEADTRRLIASAVGDFVRAFVRNGYKIVDLTGRPTTYGDDSNMLVPNVLIQNLGWIQAGVATTGAADIKAEYKKVVDRYFGKLPFFKGAVFKAAVAASSPLIGELSEAILYVVKDFNYNLLMLPYHLLVHHEKDRELRDIYTYYQDKWLRPLTEPLAVPFFDGIRLVAKGSPDAATTRRIAAILRQYRNPPSPFGNPASTTEYMTDFSTRTELRDPLYFYLHDVWEKKVASKFPDQKTNPFYLGGSIWRLGPGLVPRDNNIERASPYKLMGHNPNGSTIGVVNALREYAGHDFLLSYWFARYHGLL